MSGRTIEDHPTLEPAMDCKFIHGRLTHTTLLGSRWVPIRSPWRKHITPLLLFTWKMFISTDLTNIYALESISGRI